MKIKKKYFVIRGKTSTCFCDLHLLKTLKPIEITEERIIICSNNITVGGISLFESAEHSIKE